MALMFLSPSCSYVLAPEAQGHPAPPADSRALVARLRTWLESSPREAQLETGRLVEILAQSPGGLTKAELLAAVSESSLSLRSMRYMSALEVALNKRLQRARTRLRPYGLQICFCRETQRWQIVAEGALVLDGSSRAATKSPGTIGTASDQLLN